MWPKMLLELLPHLTRLIPAADRYLNSRQANEKAHEAVLASLAEDQRGAFAKVAGDQAALRDDLQQLLADSKQMRGDSANVRSALDGLDARITAIEKRATAIVRILWVAVGLLAALFVRVVILLRK